MLSHRILVRCGVIFRFFHIPQDISFGWRVFGHDLVLLGFLGFGHSEDSPLVQRMQVPEVNVCLVKHDNLPGVPACAVLGCLNGVIVPGRFHQDEVGKKCPRMYLKS